MTSDDRLRAAFDARVRTVDPDSLAPLVLPARGRRPRWAVPLAASIVVLVVVTGAALGGIMNGSGPHHALSVGDAPRYLVTVRDDGAAEVQDASSGRPVVSVPGGNYAAVAAAKNGAFYLRRRSPRLARRRPPVPRRGLVEPVRMRGR
ncbi:hypothetical protein [Actinomadura roseirufa]|uniref:hypothetical protein n=1 Tax=Actinomadura roseirufa TaxID=2094049 RepID=UPI001040F1CC|nr:hypothetical protein [Actinomadura roseirufa]